MFELDLAKCHAGGFHHLNRGIERARVPSDRDWHIAQVGKRPDLRILSHHDGARAHGGVEPDDLALAQLLHAFDRAPFAHRIDFERTLLKLALLPALREILHPAFGPLGIVLLIGHVEPFVGEEALLERHPPGTVVGVAVTLCSRMVRAMETTCCADGRDWIPAIMTRSARDDDGRSVGPPRWSG